VRVAHPAILTGNRSVARNARRNNTPVVTRRGITRSGLCAGHARGPVASGQIRLRLPRTVHDRAIERAQIDEVSLNTFLVGAVTEKLGVAGALAEVRALRHEIAGLVAEQNAVIERLLKA